MHAKYWLFLLISIVHAGIYAQEKPIFRGCFKTGFSFDKQALLLEPGVRKVPQTLYFIHNISSSPVVLQVKDDASSPMYLSYTSQINQEMWSVFSTDESRLRFVCKSSKTNKDLDCQKVLELCQYTDTKFPSSNNGNYWALSNQPLLNARKNINDKEGILLRW